MAHLVRSRRALELLLALEQRPEGARLAELARSGNMPLSAGQTGVGLLVAEGIAERTTGVRPHYRIRPEHPLREALLNVAARSLPPERAIQVVLGASPALEFAAQDSRGYILVRSPLAEPSQIVALKHGLERVRSGLRLSAEIETVMKFMRDYQIVRQPLPLVEATARTRAAPECRYAVVDGDGRVDLLLNDGNGSYALLRNVSVR